MVLCVVDDLLFSVKISTAAKSLGVDVFFERAADNVVPRVREKRPHLVIFDLNSSKLRPMEAIAEMKADPVLKDVRTLGFVSHVQTGTIDAARQAGVDQVLARSAFAERLGEILRRLATLIPTPKCVGNCVSTPGGPAPRCAWGGCAPRASCGCEFFRRRTTRRSPRQQEHHHRHHHDPANARRAPWLVVLVAGPAADVEDRRDASQFGGERRGALEAGVGIRRHGSQHDLVELRRNMAIRCARRGGAAVQRPARREHLERARRRPSRCRTARRRPVRAPPPASRSRAASRRRDRRPVRTRRAPPARTPESSRCLSR